MKGRTDLSLESWVVAGARSHRPGAPLNAPLVSASTFIQGGDFVYARDEGTETIVAFERLLGGMEGGHGLAFSSGMAAAAAVFEGLAVGSVVSIPDDCYQGVTGLAEAGEARGRWTLRRIPSADTDTWIAAVGDSDLVWLESPSNPLLVVADLPAICAAPRKPGGTVAVDNTFATPFAQRPLSFGADISMHSVTKYIGGHSDLLAGALVAATEDVWGGLRETRALTGAIPGALETFLATRGARTLGVRLERSQRSAAILAQRLLDHPEVDRVRYPGLPDHPTHEVARRVLDGYGSMISFDVAGDANRADAVCRATRLIHPATSLGGVESTMERRGMHPGQEHLPPNLLRLSVGCEDVEDLWKDLSSALATTA